MQTPEFSNMDNPKRPKNRGAIAVLLAALVIVGAMAALTWDSVAKYFKTGSWESAVKVGEFYFTSNYLAAGEVDPYTVTAGPDGTVDVTIALRNYEGLNKSECDIAYQVTVSPAVSVVYQDAQKTLSVTESEETVTLEGLQAGTTYTVTAVGENGFSQTLTARFIVADAVEQVFKNTKIYNDYVLLTLWTEDTAGTVTVSIPSGLTPDGTDELLRNKTAGNTVTVSLEAFTSRTLRFFITGDYQRGEIPVTGAQETVLN